MIPNTRFYILFSDVVKPGTVCLVNSDKVKVALSLKQLRQLQDNPIYGGWDENDKMQQVSIPE